MFGKLGKCPRDGQAVLLLDARSTMACLFRRQSADAAETELVDDAYRRAGIARSQPFVHSGSRSLSRSRALSVSLHPLPVIANAAAGARG